ncbi:MAG TPA: DoxX family protein [Bacteroidia bacterium]|nr:DoxX family protein [Bacteroidia bacterium]
MVFSTNVREMDAALIARVFLGFVFFLQGYDKVFRLGVKQVIQTVHQPLSEKGVPKFFSALGAYFTSYVELICGAFLILGFAKYYCLYLLGFDLLFAAIAFGIVEPVWDMRHIFPRLALLIFLLVIPSHWDVISVDYAWSLIKFVKSTF